MQMFVILFQNLLDKLKVKINIAESKIQRTIITLDDEEISIDFKAEGTWNDYLQEFQKIVCYLKEKEDKNHFNTCKIAFCYGEILEIMFKKYKSLQLEETWDNYFKKFIESKNIKMSVRGERYYRQFYKLVKEFSKIKYCGPFYKLKNQVSDIKRALELYPEYHQTFK